MEGFQNNKIKQQENEIQEENVIQEENIIQEEDVTQEENITSKNQLKNKFNKNKLKLNKEDDLDDTLVKYIRYALKNIFYYVVKFYNKYLQKSINLESLTKDNETMISGVLFIIISVGLFIDIFKLINY